MRACTCTLQTGDECDYARSTTLRQANQQFEAAAEEDKNGCAPLSLSLIVDSDVDVVVVVDVDAQQSLH